MRNCKYRRQNCCGMFVRRNATQSSRRTRLCLGMSMSTDSSPDPASFENFLANVFAVQNSGLDSQSLSALAQLRRSIKAADLAQAMEMVAERARTVADATGVAVAQLIANQLVYRAGSGSAAAYIGRHVTAVLSASASNEPRGEILRVENAQADTRIEAEVCRLYGANALLIVPIYQQHVVAGVLEVSFSEPHTFEDQEVLRYRIMARLLEETMSADAQREQKKNAPARLKSLPDATEPIAFPVDKLDGESAPPMNFVLPNNLRWNAAAAGLAAVLLIIAGFAYHHHSVSRANAASAAKSNAAQEHVAANRPLPNSPNSETSASGTASKSPGSGFRRVRVGQDEIDYIAEDVTIRHFTSHAAPPQMLAGERLVNFGEDVTVRYFGPKPQVAPQIQP